LVAHISSKNKANLIMTIVPNLIASVPAKEREDTGICNRRILFAIFRRPNDLPRLLKYYVNFLV